MAGQFESRMLIMKGFSLVFLLFLAACVPQPNVKFVAFGDSSTKEYPAFLREILDVPRSAIVNEAEGGESSGEGLERLDEIVMWNKYPNAEYFLYWQGGNDLIDFLQRRDPFLLWSPSGPSYPFEAGLNQKLREIETNLEFGVNMAKDEGWIVCIATYYPFMSGLECSPLPFDMMTEQQAVRANEYKDLLNEVIRIVAAESGARLVAIDSNAEILQIDNYENCNHLNEIGNILVAQMFADAIGEAE